MDGYVIQLNETGIWIKTVTTTNLGKKYSLNAIILVLALEESKDYMSQINSY